MNNAELLSQAFLAKQPQACARLLEEASPEQAAAFLEKVPVDIVTPAVSAMANWPATRVLCQLPRPLSAEILGTLAPNKAEILLRLMGAEHRENIIQKMPADIARGFKLKLTYPVSTVGAWMDTSMPYFTPDSRVADCLDLIQQQKSHLGGIVLVVDEFQHLIGLADINSLITSAAREPLINLVHKDLKTPSARATLWEVIDFEGWSDFSSLPVTGPNNLLLGVLTHSALIEGTRKKADEPSRPQKFSLMAHMCRAFFVSLIGFIEVVGGISRPSNQGKHKQG